MNLPYAEAAAGRSPFLASWICSYSWWRSSVNRGCGEDNDPPAEIDGLVNVVRDEKNRHAQRRPPACPARPWPYPDSSAPECFDVPALSLVDLLQLPDREHCFEPVSGIAKGHWICTMVNPSPEEEANISEMTIRISPMHRQHTECRRSARDRTCVRYFRRHARRQRAGRERPIESDAGTPPSSGFPCAGRTRNR